VPDDVDDDLVALARGAGLDSVVERARREQAQRVSLLLGHGRRLRGNVGRKRSRGNVIQRLLGRIQGLPQHGADLRLEPSADDALYVLGGAGPVDREQSPSVSGVATRVSARTVAGDSPAGAA